nr:portal protein [Mangrovicoccus algicola]
MDKAQAERSRLEPMFDDAIRLTMPGRRGFNMTDWDPAWADIYDETGANAVEEFASRMQAGFFPSFSRFIQLEASSLIAPKDRAAVNRDLEEICQYLFEEIWVSNFATEAAESLTDLALSTGTLCVEEGFGGNRLHHQSIPLTELLLETGPAGQIGGQFREQRDVPVTDVPAILGQHYDDSAAPVLAADIRQNVDRKVTLVTHTYRDFTSRDTERSWHIVLVKETKEIVCKRELTGRGSNPFLSFRMGKIEGGTWGRGPLMRSLGAVRTTNLMVELVLENAAMAITGIYQTDNDGTVNADNISLLPGTILSREIGTRGLEPIAAATGSFQMQDVVLGDQRTNIKRAMYNDMLSDPNRTPATAYEVSERMADLAHRTAAGFSRIFYEFVQPYIWRALYLLEKRGDIQLPTQNGRALNFRPTSPLARAQSGRDLQALIQDFSLRAQIYGPQAAAMSYETEELETWLQARNGLDERIFKTPADMARSMQEMQQQMMQMQAQMQQMGATGK